MRPRTFGSALLIAAAVVGVVAASLGFDPCLTAGIAIVCGLIGLIVIVVAHARRTLAASRADLMRSAQMCPTCGYTIRAITDRCPECGTPRSI